MAHIEHNHEHNKYQTSKTETPLWSPLFFVFVDISMQDKVVIYDNEMQRIGWAPEKNCDQLPKSESTSI